MVAVLLEQNSLQNHKSKMTPKVTESVDIDQEVIYFHGYGQFSYALITYVGEETTEFVTSSVLDGAGIGSVPNWYESREEALEDYDRQRQYLLSQEFTFSIKTSEFERKLFPIRPRN